MGQHLSPHIFVQTSGLPQKNGNNNGDCDIPGDPEVTANIYCKSRNLPNRDTQNYSTDNAVTSGSPNMYINQILKTIPIIMIIS